MVDAESTLLPALRSWLREAAQDCSSSPQDFTVVLFLNCPALGVLTAGRTSWALNLITNVLADFPTNGICFLVKPNRAAAQVGRSWLGFGAIANNNSSCSYFQENIRHHIVLLNVFSCFWTPKNFWGTLRDTLIWCSSIASSQLFCSALRKSEKQDPKEEDDADMEVKKGERSGSDSDDEKKKDESDTLDVRDVGYNLEILTLCLCFIRFQKNISRSLGFFSGPTPTVAGTKSCATTDAWTLMFSPIISEFRHPRWYRILSINGKYHFNPSLKSKETICPQGAES